MLVWSARKTNFGLADLVVVGVVQIRLVKFDLVGVILFVDICSVGCSVEMILFR